MKKALLFTLAILFALTYAKAQATDPELDYIKKAYSKDKKTIVDEYMALDVQEGAKFWPVYGAYEASREKLAQERYGLINESALNNNINLEKLNLNTYGKVKKAIGPIKAAKYMQLETYLQTTWRVIIQDNIPLIGSLDKTQQKQ